MWRREVHSDRFSRVIEEDCERRWSREKQRRIKLLGLVPEGGRGTADAGKLNGR